MRPFVPELHISLTRSSHTSATNTAEAAAVHWENVVTRARNEKPLIIILDLFAHFSHMRRQNITEMETGVAGLLNFLKNVHLNK